jgi:ribosome-binding factor A
LEFQRSHRVGEAIHKDISALLLRGLKDPRIGFVTVTMVEVTSDLHLAKVYYTVMGDEAARRETEKGLKSSVPYLRRQLGQHLRLRYVPELIFVFDSSLEYGNRIESLIRKIQDDTLEADDSGDTGKD